MQNYANGTNMLIYQDCVVFNILGLPIYLISNETAYGQQTVAEIHDTYHYLGAQPWTLDTAIHLYERLHQRKLNAEELTQVLRDNNFVSGGI
jgi:hypothetical protein